MHPLRLPLAIEAAPQSRRKLFAGAESSCQLLHMDAMNGRRWLAYAAIGIWIARARDEAPRVWGRVP